MSDNIKVVVKVRPLISREIEDKLCYQWRINNNTLYQIDQNGRDVGQNFTFDKVYGEDTKTIDVYNDIAKPIVKTALSGINGTIFAYGQTSSGKTYTMMGTDDSPGIIQLAVLDLFNSIKNMEDRDFLLRVSYIEIYNDQIKDLLNIESSEKIKIHVTHQGIKVDVTEKVTSSTEEVLNVMREGELNRQIGATNMNEASSRSHSIFQITIESREHTEVGDEAGPVNISQLNLVDLAGSERAGQTGATGDRFKEGTHINKSLSSLALVIKQLSENNRHTSYRDSKLTHILQNSLGGNAKTSIICAVTPAALDETISTLQFANRAKAIKNKPEVNAIVSNVSMIQTLTKQLTQLQTQLASKKQIEDDLKAKIASLKGQIIYGFERTRDVSAANRRKTWCAPPRLPIEIPSAEVDVPRFCTPGLKYNPLVLGVSEFHPIQRAESVSRLPRVPEEQRTPPRERTVNFDDEIIEINSDDDELASPVTGGVCSPYHECHGSKTPPCALRDRAEKAEKRVKSILILTEREKIYPPTVEEVMEKLDQNTTVITKLEKTIEELNKRCEGKDEQVNQLQAKLDTAQKEISTACGAKTELESRCEALKTKLTDTEVSYETLKQKAKSREEDLLSLLEEQRTLLNKRHGQRTLEKDPSNLMNSSKDYLSIVNFSLINSDDDDDTSIIAPKDNDLREVQEMLLTDLQTQINTKNEMIEKSEAELTAFKDKISQLETANGDIETKVQTLNNQVETLEANKTMLETTVETLKTTIQSQKENLDRANKDIESYDELIKDLQSELKEVTSQVLDSNSQDLMMANEKQFVANNDALKTMIESLKSVIESRNKEIERLNDEVYSKCAKIKGSVEETNRLNQEIESHIKHIDRLTEEKSIILKSKEHLALELTEALENCDKFNKQKDEIVANNQELQAKVREMSGHIEELEDSNRKKDDNIRTMQESDRTTELTSELHSTISRIQNVVNSLMYKEKSNVGEQFNYAAISLQDALASLESAQKEVQGELTGLRERCQELQQSLDTHMNSKADKQIQFETLSLNYQKLVNKHNDLEKQLEIKEEHHSDLLKEYQRVQELVEDYKKSVEVSQLKENELALKFEGQTSQLQEMSHECQRLKSENESLQKTQFMSHDETLSFKDQEIARLEDQVQEMQMLLHSQKTKMADEVQIAEEQIKCMQQTLECILDNVINIANTHSIEYKLSADKNNSLSVFNQIPNVLDTIVNGLKKVYTVESNNQIEIIQGALSTSKTEITDLQSQIQRLENDLVVRNNENQKWLEKLNAIESDNKDLSNELNHCNQLIGSLKEEIQVKRDMLENIEDSTRTWKDKFLAQDQSLSEQIKDLQIKNAELTTKCSALETKINKTSVPLTANFCDSINIAPIETNSEITTPITNGPNNPQSLMSICCNKIVDALDVKEEEYTITPTSSDTTICQCNDLYTKLQDCERKIIILKAAIEHYKTENAQLFEENTGAGEQLKLLLSEMIELHKKLALHKTHLATLTNTTYAETRLLKSQVKSLEHHHSSLHNVCQRDIQKLKKQLRELYLVLHSEYARGDAHNSSFKRFSLPTILDHVTLSKLRNESTLDGDLLMLDTNVTLASTDITLMCHDQTCFDITQTDNETEGINPVPTDAVSVERLVDDNKKLIQKIHSYSEENRNLKEEIQKSSESFRDHIRNSSFKEESGIKIVVTPCNDTNVCKGCQDKEDLKSDLQKLSQELTELKAQKADLEDKFNNLSLDVPSSEALVRKLSALEKDLSVKGSKIARLTKEIEDKNNQLKHLQEENDTLSTQIMENITEVDDLKKDLDMLKVSNTELDGKCKTLEAIVKQHVPKLADVSVKKLLSNSEILNRSQNSDTSRKFSTLQNELHASREDCKKITEDVATIKSHFERSNLSIGQNMDLDDSMGETNFFNFTKDFGTVDAQSMSKLASIPESLDYSMDKTDCLTYFLEKTGANKENFQHEVKIIDIMKMLYNNLETIHANEIQNLTNALRHYEETKNALETEIDNITSKYSQTTEELERHQKIANSVSETTAAVKNSIETLISEMSSGDGDTNTKFVAQFKEQILKYIDNGLSTNTIDVFEALIDKIAVKHQNDLSSINEQYTKLLQHMETLATELTSVNENVNQMKEQLQDKEREYNLLKCQRDKMHEISSAVTLDIVKKEEALSNTITQGYKRLIEHNIMQPDEIDWTNPMNNNVTLIFERLINQSQMQIQISEQENEKQKLALEVRNSSSLLKEKVSELEALQSEIAQLKVDNVELRTEIETKSATIVTNNEEVECMKQEIYRLQNQIACNEEVIKSFESEQSDKMDSDDQLTDFIQKTKDLQTENAKLRSLHEKLIKQKEECAVELEKSGMLIENYKADIEKMSARITELQNSLQSYVSLLDDMKVESNELQNNNKLFKNEIEQLSRKVDEINKQYEEKCRDCSRFELNMKTHEKTLEIQNKIITRLQKQKEEDVLSISEKEARISELEKEIKTCKDDFNHIQTFKDTLQIRLTELENEAKDDNPRVSLEAVGSHVRRRRQSIHDSRRVFAEDRIDQDDHRLGEARSPRRDDLCGDGGSSGRSTPSRISRRRDSLHLTEQSPPPRPSSAGSAAARLRRQSTHDAVRNVAAGDSTDSLTVKMRDDAGQSKSSEKSADISDADIRSRLAACEKELEELKESYKELDDECETCAQYLHERDDQNARLRKEKAALEKTIADLKSAQPTINTCFTNAKRSFSNAAVNTDEDWANLHSVVVDRMSFDAEVDKNKRLTRAIEDFRIKNRDLKAHIAKMQKALERQAEKNGSKELEDLKKELESCKEENEALKQQNRELDEECDGCAEAIRERDERLMNLKEAKATLEARIQELQMNAKEIAQSARKKRQSLHDMNREARPDMQDASTETIEDMLSYQVERDTTSRLAAEYEAKSKEMITLNATIDTLSRQKVELERRLAAATAQSARQPQEVFVATGSAIVQNQQITDLYKENQKLKKLNAKLIGICKKRGKALDSEPTEQG